MNWALLPSCGDEVLGEVGRQAVARGVRIHTHTNENLDEIALVRQRFGKDNSACARWCPLGAMLALVAVLIVACGGSRGSNNGGPLPGNDAGIDGGTPPGNDAGADGGSVEPPLDPAPDPASVAPPLSRAVTTPFATANEFLFNAVPAVQTGVTSGAIDPPRMAVVRGRITDIDGQPLPGVKVTILGHPELGRTVSRLDGGFDLAVNGGGPLTVVLDKPGYLGAQRSVQTRWESFASVPDVALVRFDAQATQVGLGAGAPQVAQGSPVNDGDGARQAMLLFPAGTQATVRLADGRTLPLSTMTVRATEYTVGPHGPNAMPADLPPTSGYTYAVEFSVDEAVAMKATGVVFDRPVFSYTDNFLHFGVGSVVPAGYYDPAQAAWVPSSNGRVLKVLAVNGGRASLDVDGSGTPATPAALAALGIGPDELTTLGTLYAAGKTFWRVPVTHFSAWDFNWPFAPPAGSTAPGQPPPKATGKTEDDPCNRGGSIIECQNQVLGEVLPVAGTPYTLNYRSNRVPGGNAGLQIPLSGSAVPAALKRIDLEVLIAGRTIQQSFPATPNQSTLFVWDGKDAYGRPVQGHQAVTVRVGFTYDGVYLTPSELPGPNYDRLFGHFSYFGTPATGDRTRREVTLWQEYALGSVDMLGGWDARGTGLGGWELDVHHAYDPIGRALYLGNGDQRTTTSVDRAVTRFANVPSLFSGGTFGPDGSLYLVGGDGSVRRRSPAGIITTVAGLGVPGNTSGDEGPATQAGMDASRVVLGPDGIMYILDHATDIVRRVTPDGIIHAFAGKPQSNPRSSTGDGGRAVDATLWAHDVAIGPDGSVYVSDEGSGNGCTIRRVGTDGIISTVAGNGNLGFGGDGGRATAAPLGVSCSIAVDRNGSLYILGSVPTGSSFSDRLLRVGPDGIIHHVAGNGALGGGGDGGDAKQASLQFSHDLTVDGDGSIYFSTAVPDAPIRRIDQQGIIRAVAGNAVALSCLDRTLGVFALDFPLCGLPQLLIAPDGVLHVIEGSWEGDIFRLGTLLPGFNTTDIVLASADGTELYRFDGLGHHVSTVSALTKAELGRFTYDAAGALLTVTDGNGNVTTIERDGSGRALAIVGPFGQRTTLTLDVNGFLSSVSDPAGRSTSLQSSPLGLLTQLTDPAGNVHTFTYDPAGRLTRDQDPWGGFAALSRVDSATDLTVTVTSPLNRTQSYQVASVPTGKRRTNTDATGLKSIQDYAFNGNLTVTAADGVVQTIAQAADPRWFLQAPILSSLSVKTPAALTRSASFARSVMLGDATDPTSLLMMTDTTTVNGRKFTEIYDATTRVLTRTSAANRTSMLTIDALHRPTRYQLGTMEPTLTSYDAQGRIVSLQIGASAGARAFSFTYSSSGLLTQATDPGGGITGYTYDDAGRVTAHVFPDGSTVAYEYDALDNLLALTPPGRPAHAFTYSAGKVASYLPPDVGGLADIVFFAYDLEGALTRLTRADGRTVDFGYA